MTKQADVLQELMNVFNGALQRNDLDGLLRAFYPLEEIALEEKDYKLLGGLFALVTESLFKNDRTELLIRYCVKFLEMATSIPELLAYEDYYSIAASLDFILEDHDMAMEHVLQEIALHEKNDNQRGIANRLCKIAELQLLKGNTSEALNTILDAKMILQELGLLNEVYGIINKGVIAKIYIEIGEYDRAKNYLDEMLVWYGLDDHYNLKVELHTSYAQYYEALEDKERAIIYYKEAIELAEEKHFEAELKDLYLTMSKTYEAHKDYENSHYYLKKYVNQMEEAYKRKQSVLKINAELELSLLQSEKKNKQLSNKIGANHETNDIDLLTGLYNETYIINLMNRMVRHNKVLGKNLTLLLLKIPAIKEVHNLDGMTEMDDLIVIVSNALTTVKRRNHIIGRLSVDRFAICMVDESVEQGRITAQRYMDVLMNREPAILVYGGIVDDSKENAVDADTLVRMADIAIYQSENLSHSQLSVW